MKMFEYKVADLEQIHSVPRGFFESVVCIVDNEIANDLSPDWNYEHGKIICTGILYGNIVKIFIAEKLHDIDFKTVVIEELERCRLDFKVLAFNRHMEMGNFNGWFDYEIDIAEIKPFNAKGWNKDKFFNTLIERGKIPDVKIIDPFSGDGSKCIEKWYEYQRNTNNFQPMMEIVSHNLNCLLKEVTIYKNLNFFHKHYDIDAGGFMVGEKKH